MPITSVMDIGPTPEQAAIGFIIAMMCLGMLVYLRMLTIYRANELVTYKKALAVQQARAQFIKGAYASGVGDDDGSVVEIGADEEMCDVVEVMEGEEVDTDHPEVKDAQPTETPQEAQATEEVIEPVEAEERVPVGV